MAIVADSIEVLRRYREDVNMSPITVKCKDITYRLNERTRVISSNSDGTSTYLICAKGLTPMDITKLKSLKYNTAGFKLHVEKIQTMRGVVDPNNPVAPK